MLHDYPYLTEGIILHIITTPGFLRLGDI